jgi:hypothetical protein
MRPLGECVLIDAARIRLPTLVRPEVHAMRLVVGKMILSRWRNRREHHEGVQFLQVREQHHPPTFAQVSPQMSQVRFLHECPWKPAVHLRRPPAGAVRSAGRLIACHLRRSRGLTRRPALATRVAGLPRPLGSHATQAGELCYPAATAIARGGRKRPLFRSRRFAPLRRTFACTARFLAPLRT